MPDLDEDEIRTRAHKMWEDEGRPEGQDTHFWFRAVEELMAEQGNTGRPTEGPGGLSTGLQPGGVAPVGGATTTGSIGTGGAATGNVSTGSAGKRDGV